MTKLLIITGLTGSGKSSLAIKIAKKYNGEIISADSVQIYKDLNIGSAKENTENLKTVKHHLINIKDFKCTYNVDEFIKDCNLAINNIVKKGKLPIIVGGTGLYIKALIEGYALGSAADTELRIKYQKLAESKGNIAVWEELNKLNSEKAKTVHFNNLKRVIRYIEIEVNTNSKPQKTESIISKFDTLSVGIVAERQDIYNKINTRVDKMIADGLEDEVMNLIENGATKELQSMNSIGYKEWFDYYSGQNTLIETINLIKQHTRNYCKRQLTFLKTIPNIQLLTLLEAEEKIERFLNDRD